MDSTYKVALYLPKPDKPRFNPPSRIKIKSAVRKDGRCFLTPSCVSFPELNYEIKRLERELAEMRWSRLETIVSSITFFSADRLSHFIFITQ